MNVDALVVTHVIGRKIRKAGRFTVYGRKIIKDSACRDYSSLLSVESLVYNCTVYTVYRIHYIVIYLKIRRFWKLSKGHYPESCGLGSRFDERKIKSIEDDLEENWPNFYSRGSGFWKHEWDKHGRCSVGNESESRLH